MTVKSCNQGTYSILRHILNNIFYTTEIKTDRSSWLTHEVPISHVLEVILIVQETNHPLTQSQLKLSKLKKKKNKHQQELDSMEKMAWGRKQQFIHINSKMSTSKMKQKTFVYTLLFIHLKLLQTGTNNSNINQLWYSLWFPSFPAHFVCKLNQYKVCSTP